MKYRVVSFVILENKVEISFEVYTFLKLLSSKRRESKKPKTK